MNLPNNIPIVIYQGETFNPPPITFQGGGVPINITGYAVVMTVRQTYNSNVIALQASTSNGYITVNGTLGQINVLIPAAVIATVAPFQGVWDLFIFSPSGIATRLLGGSICIPESVYQ